MIRDYDALTAYLDARLTTPFAWGRRANDCVSYGLGAVLAQGGRDLAREAGADWSTVVGAARVLKRLGGMQAAFDRLLDVVPAAHAMRGDLGLVEGQHGPLIVVVEGELVSGPGPDGAQRFPRADLLRAWSIG